MNPEVFNHRDVDTVVAGEMFFFLRKQYSLAKFGYAEYEYNLACVQAHKSKLLIFDNC